MANRADIEAIPHPPALIERAAALWGDAPCLHFDETGETVADLAATVRAKAAAYRAISGQIAGLRRATNAAIDARMIST